MGRPAATREFLEKLIEWAGSPAAFRQLTGIHASNLTDYRSGKKSIDWKRLRRAAAQVTGLPSFAKLVEVYDISGGLPSVNDMPDVPGIYALYDYKKQPIYWGKATKLRAEIRQTLNRAIASKKAKGVYSGKTFKDVSNFISAYSIQRSDADFRTDIEAIGLRVFRGFLLNANNGDFQRKH